ncbi:type II secretion system protein GspG [bacterium]|nr:type II secretion system protein GspG [bacterium]
MRYLLIATLALSLSTPLRADEDTQDLLREGVKVSWYLKWGAVCAAAIALGSVVVIWKTDPERKTTRHLHQIRYEDLQHGKTAKDLEELVRQSGDSAFLRHRLNDAWGKPIVRSVLPDGSYEVRSFGPDGQPHTEDDLSLSY